MGYSDQYRSKRQRKSDILRHPVFVVHCLEHACAALEAAGDAGLAVDLLSPSSVVTGGGIAWFKGVIDGAQSRFPNVPFRAILDCGDFPGYAMSAVLGGWKTIILAHADRHRDASGGKPSAIVDIVGKHGARIIERPVDVCDLGPFGDGRYHARRYVGLEDQ